jgi:MoxR-like ATPase
MLCLRLDYPTGDEEVEVLLQTTRGVIAPVEAVMDYEDILRFQGTVNRIAVSRRSAEYAARLVRSTRPDGDCVPEWVSRVVDWGAGPRAGQSLLRAAKALAAMDGRPAISSEDIRDVAPAVLRHRVSCNYRSKTEGMDENGLVMRLLGEVSSR